MNFWKYFLCDDLYPMLQLYFHIKSPSLFIFLLGANMEIEKLFQTLHLPVLFYVRACVSECIKFYFLSVHASVWKIVTCKRCCVCLTLNWDLYSILKPPETDLLVSWATDSAKKSVHLCAFFIESSWFYATHIQYYARLLGEVF